MKLGKSAIGRWLSRHAPLDPPFATAVADTVSGRSIRQADDEPTIIDISQPNVFTFLVVTDRSQVVLYRSTPGDTTPRIAIIDDEGEQFDCGEVIQPEDFGPLGTTKADFLHWVEAFTGGRR